MGVVWGCERDQQDRSLLSLNVSGRKAKLFSASDERWSTFTSFGPPQRRKQTGICWLVSKPETIRNTGLQEMREGGLPGRAGSPVLTRPAVTAPHGDHF
jgi:hypothetical protein